LRGGLRSNRGRCTKQQGGGDNNDSFHRFPRFAPDARLTLLVGVKWLRFETLRHFNFAGVCPARSEQKFVLE
jgi:hypothetical protein